MTEAVVIKVISATWRICRWFFWQILLFYGMPYLWQEHYDVVTIALMLLYTTLYSIYWEFVSKENRFRLLYSPYLIYIAIAVTLCFFIKAWSALILFSLLIPLYGIVCVFITKICRKYFRKIRKRYKSGWVITYTALAMFLITMKSVGVYWECSRQGSPDEEKEEILARRDYLLNKLISTPQNVLDEMPASIGTQFQGEWALYSCSMLSAALVNISQTISGNPKGTYPIY